jgi:hypothetical protein
MASGPGLTLAEMETHSRLLAQDGDTTNPGLTSAQYTSLINQRYLHYFRQIEPRISWVSATTSGLTLALNTRVKAITDASVTTRIDEVIGLFDEGTNSDAATATQGQPLKREDLMVLLSESVYLAVEAVDASLRGAPTKYAVLRDDAEPTSATTLRGAVTIYFNKYSPIVRYYSVMLRRSPTKLSNTDDTADVTPEGTYIIATLAAYDAARLLGGSSRDPGFLEGILKFVPQDIQERLLVARGERDPAVTGGKARA